MLAPSAIILGLFIVYPLGRAVWLGQQRCSAGGDRCVSNGFQQYVDVFRSTEFQSALLVTAKFALISVPLGLVLGVGLAVLADKYLRGIGFFRSIFSSTIATSVAVASLMWLFLLQPSVGSLANLDWFNSLFPSVKNPGWLQDPGTALSPPSHCRACGRGSDSPSSSSPPRCSRSPVSCTKPPQWMGRRAHSDSGRSPSRCWDRR